MTFYFPSSENPLSERARSARKEGGTYYFLRQPMKNGGSGILVVWSKGGIQFDLGGSKRSELGKSVTGQHVFDLSSEHQREQLMLTLLDNLGRGRLLHLKYVERLTGFCSTIENRGSGYCRVEDLDGFLDTPPGEESTEPSSFILALTEPKVDEIIMNWPADWARLRPLTDGEITARNAGKAIHFSLLIKDIEAGGKLWMVSCAIAAVVQGGLALPIDFPQHDSPSVILRKGPWSTLQIDNDEANRNFEKTVLTNLGVHPDDTRCFDEIAGLVPAIMKLDREDARMSFDADSFIRGVVGVQHVKFAECMRSTTLSELQHQAGL